MCFRQNSVFNLNAPNCFGLSDVNKLIIIMSDNITPDHSLHITNYIPYVGDHNVKQRHCTGKCVKKWVQKNKNRKQKKGL